MKTVFSLLALFFLSFCAFTVRSQELNCKVEINTQKIQGREQDLDALRESINEYMNSTRFTPYQFSQNEKIECRLFLTVNGFGNDFVKGELQIQSTRPVYNSSYSSTLLNIKDNDVEFEYRLNDRLVFSENTIESNLTALLDFYAYLILAVDLDSFSPEGGEYCYERLQNIVQKMQASGDAGWKSYSDNRNRAAVLASFTDPNTKMIRQLIYEYHRKGLDEMSLVPDKGRMAITGSLDYLEKIREKAPMSVALTIWHDSKLDELINVYSKGTQSERTGVHDLLSRLYPTDSRRLQAILDPPPTR